MSFIKQRAVLSVSVVTLLISCSPSESKKQVALFQKHCASCHIAPEINHLPREIWASAILPEMGARMGIKDSAYNPLKGLSFDEMDIINQTGIYPALPTISEKDWQLLKDYIISQAPDSLNPIENKAGSSELVQFIPKPISLDSTQGTFITFLEYDSKHKSLFTGDLSGNLFQYDFNEGKNVLKGHFGSAVTAYTQLDTIAYATAVGRLNPSEFYSGSIFAFKNDASNPVAKLLHRPVNTLVYDLNHDGNNELVVSEFGNLTGKLSLLNKTDSTGYQKKILLNQPGTIRVLAKDMNDDGREDLIALTSQGDETITILYQQNDLSFIPEKVIRLSPVYGISWFELIDFDGDGDDDVITANGDNADKSYVHKPYHGIRIHINDGNNNFEEKYFYPLNGATRLVARDFDADGDIDLGIVSSFPDYDNNPEFSFVYLENTDSKSYQFKPYTFENSKLGKWFLMDAGDVDDDGDIDIILSSFTYTLTPVPEKLSSLWNEKKVDLMLLENKLRN